MSYDGPVNAFPGDHELPISLYGYTPNRGFNSFAAVVWGLVLAAHVWWLIKKRTRGIQAMIVIGSIWELIGYAIRAHTHLRPFRADLFIAQYTILHTAPIFFIMALVNAIGWGMRGTDNASVYERFRPRTLTSVLQALNAIVLILVTIGSTMYAVALARLANLEDVRFKGSATRKVLIAGHALKIVSLLAILAILTHLFLHFKRDSVRHTRHTDGPIGTTSATHTAGTHTAADGTTTTTHTGPHSATTGTHTTAIDQTATGPHTGRAITKLFLAISFLTAGMLLTRTCYRLAETVQDVYSRPWNSEALFGVFEFAITWSFVAIWAARPFATQLAPAGIVRAHDGVGHTDKAHV